VIEELKTEEFEEMEDPPKINEQLRFEDNASVALNKNEAEAKEGVRA
jgi:hypothetical protein